MRSILQNRAGLIPAKILQDAIGSKGDNRSRGGARPSWAGVQGQDQPSPPSSGSGVILGLVTGSNGNYSQMFIILAWHALY